METNILYYLARRPSKFKRALYLYVVPGITLPTFTMLIPQIKLINALNLQNTYSILILLYVSGGMPMGIFLFNGHFSGASGELEDAAKIAGCSYYRTFFQIFLPLSVATASTLVLVQSIGIWNDVTLPVLINNKTHMQTLIMVGQGTRWERVYTFSASCMFPMLILFLIVNKYLISGVAEGALKD